MSAKSAQGKNVLTNHATKEINILPVYKPKRFHTRLDSKIDVEEALKLKLSGHSYADLGIKYNCSPQAVEQKLSRFKAFLTDTNTISAYATNEIELIRAARLKMLINIIDEDKLKKATTGNCAYAWDKLLGGDRLLSGQSTQNIAYESTSSEYQATLKQLQQLESSGSVPCEFTGEIVEDEDKDDL